jgi:hypothetical protein
MGSLYLVVTKTLIPSSLKTGVKVGQMKESASHPDRQRLSRIQGEKPDSAMLGIPDVGAHIVFWEGR